MKRRQLMQDIYKINEIFYSIQGEGTRAGTANIFIRFSGCNLKCSFCDTEHESFTEMSINDIVNEMKLYPCNWVILTGGEPTIHDLKPLIKRLKKLNYKIAIETNGTNSTRFLNLDWIAVSPKKAWIHGDYYFRKPDEMKIIVQKTNKILDWDFESIMFLQPESNKPDCIRRCIDIIKKDNRWRLSLQIQKILKIR